MDEDSSPSNGSQAESEATMTFDEAIAEVIIGKKIHKLEWQDKEYYGFLEDERLKLHKPGGSTHDWIISSGDLMGNDWIVL